MLEWLVVVEFYFQLHFFSMKYTNKTNDEKIIITHLSLAQIADTIVGSVAEKKKKLKIANNISCPKFTFESPLLDKNVAKMLSKSFIIILNLNQQNLKDNNNLRLSVLEKIRQMCQIVPVNHKRIDENITALLKEVYKQKSKVLEDDTESTNKDLEAFLIRNMKDMNITSNYKPSINPEIMQALNNLDENIHENTIEAFRDIIHWDSTDNKYIHILKSLWANEDCNNDDIYIKLKSEIEKILLEICYNVLNDTNTYIKEHFTSNSSLLNTVKKSAVSANCFQICCNILNYVFINTNFDTNIQIFVHFFVKHVKESCTNTISALYPVHVSHVVVLLDVELEELEASVQKDYVKTTVQYLSKLQSESENDLIMLLSHYPKWFHIFFKD